MLPENWTSYLPNQKLVDLYIYTDRFITKYPETELYAKTNYLWPLLDEIENRDLIDQVLHF